MKHLKSPTELFHRFHHHPVIIAFEMPHLCTQIAKKNVVQGQIEDRTRDHVDPNYVCYHYTIWPETGLN